MRKLLIALLVPLALVACKKNPELTPVNETIPSSPAVQTQTKGAFMNGVHPTSGNVKVVKDTDGSQNLVFENFKTDSGPDLRVYLAEDKMAKNFVEVALLTKSGTFTIKLPTNAQPEQRNYVLIWCRQFSVLFGSAELQ